VGDRGSDVQTERICKGHTGELAVPYWLGLATGLSWLCYFRALQLGPASKVAPIDKLSVIFVIVLAFLFLGETLSPLKLLGGGADYSRCYNLGPDALIAVL
jgi:drug/metabolite transporter (DMT)-like permease